jgi:hypothetical protein
MYKEEQVTSYDSKEVSTLPEGAEVIKKSHSIRVEEIENGYIVCKSYDIKYTLNGDTDYLYYTKKVFSKDNPIQVDEDKMLAEYFD